MIPDPLITGGLAGLYCGPAPDPGAIWGRWNLDPLLLAALAALALGIGRSWAGLAAVAALAAAFVSPLCALSAALFSARVVHHLLLVALAAPLIALALPAKVPRGATPLFVPGIRARAAAWTHAGIAVVLLSILGANWGYRLYGYEEAVLPYGILLSGFSVFMVGATGWHGGKLVFDYHLGTSETGS